MNLNTIIQFIYRLHYCRPRSTFGKNWLPAICNCSRGVGDFSSTSVGYIRGLDRFDLAQPISNCIIYQVLFAGMHLQRCTQTGSDEYLAINDDDFTMRLKLDSAVLLYWLDPLQTRCC